jgi:glycine cleavage system H lipoate-binding protein
MGEDDMTDTKQSTKRLPQVLDLTSDQCVWAQAKVVAPRACHNAFDCTGCSFDQLIQRRLATGRLLAESGDPTVSWRDPSRYQRAAYTERPCRHMLSGLLPVKYCARNFECATCPVDQMLEDAGPLQEPHPPQLEEVAGFQWARGHYVSAGHLWARVEYGGRVRVGIDDFAARLLGPPTGLQLPRLGATVGAQEPAFTLARDDRRAALPSPVPGVVLAVNPALETRPQEAHRSPYERGWLFLLEPRRLQSSLKRLRFDDEAFTWIEQEAARLARLLSGDPAAATAATAAPEPAARATPAEEPTHEAPVRLAATGGHALDDIVGQVPEADWETLVAAFLTPRE